MKKHGNEQLNEQPEWEAMWAEDRGPRKPKLYTTRTRNIYFSDEGVMLDHKGVTLAISSYNLIYLRRLVSNES